jgi:hypothetical protein
MPVDPKAKEKDILNELLVSIGNECDRVEKLSSKLGILAFLMGGLGFWFGTSQYGICFVLAGVGFVLFKWLMNVSSYHKEVADDIFKVFDCPRIILQRKGGADEWIYSVLDGKSKDYSNMTLTLHVFYKSYFPKFNECPFKLNIPSRNELENAMKSAHPDGHRLDLYNS